MDVRASIKQVATNFVQGQDLRKDVKVETPIVSAMAAAMNKIIPRFEGKNGEKLGNNGAKCANAVWGAGVVIGGTALTLSGVIPAAAFGAAAVFLIGAAINRANTSQSHMIGSEVKEMTAEKTGTPKEFDTKPTLDKLNSIRDLVKVGKEESIDKKELSALFRDIAHLANKCPEDNKSLTKLGELLDVMRDLGAGRANPAKLQNPELHKEASELKLKLEEKQTSIRDKISDAVYKSNVEKAESSRKWPALTDELAVILNKNNSLELANNFGLKQSRIDEVASLKDETFGVNAMAEKFKNGRKDVTKNKEMEASRFADTMDGTAAAIGEFYTKSLDEMLKNDKLTPKLSSEITSLKESLSTQLDAIAKTKGTAQQLNYIVNVEWVDVNNKIGKIISDYKKLETKATAQATNTSGLSTGGVISNGADAALQASKTDVPPPSAKAPQAEAQAPAPPASNLQRPGRKPLTENKASAAAPHSPTPKVEDELSAALDILEMGGHLPENKAG